MQTHSNKKLAQHSPAANRSEVQQAKADKTLASASQQELRPIQRQIQDSTHVHQLKQQQQVIQEGTKASPTPSNGLPTQLKTGIENLSGIAMDDVHVHYNSSKPAQLNAHAYAQGNQIHLSPGQEQHLPHEAWHVVQQKQGRVAPTKQLKSKVNINHTTSSVVQRKTANLPDTLSQNYSRFYYRGGDFSHLYGNVEDYNRIPMGSTDYAKQVSDLDRIINRRTEAEQSLFDFIDGEKSANARTWLELEQEKNTKIAEKKRLERGRNKEHEVRKVDYEIHLIKAKMTVQEQYYEDNNRKLKALGGMWTTFMGQVDHEKTAVEQQMENHSYTATVPRIDTSRGGYLRNRAPNRINALLNDLTTAGSPNAKLPIVMKLDKEIYAWKKKHTDTAGQLLPKFEHKPDNNEAKLAAIKLIEHQLQYTRNRVLHDVFSGGHGGVGDGEGYSKGVLAFGKGATGMLATAARGSRFEGGAATSTGLAGDAKKSIDPKFKEVVGFNMDAKGLSKLSESLNAIGAGTNAIGQVFRLVEVADSWRKVKTKRDVMNALLESLGLATTAAAEVTMAGDNVDKFLDGKTLSAKASTWDDMSNWAKSAVVTKGLAQGIFALKNIAEGILHIRDAYKRAGVDNEAMLSHSLHGGISLTKAVIAGMRTAQSVAQIINKTIPSAVTGAIPFVSFALNFIEAIEGLYRWIIGRKYKNKMEEELTAFHKKSSIESLLADGEAARDEKRGVMAMFGPLTVNKYRRIHPYILSKIDEQVAANTTGKLKVKMKNAPRSTHGAVRKLTPQKIKDIREYEYLSKMKEINQKRQVKGGLDVIKAVTTAAADVMSVAHLGIIPGVALKAFMTGGSLTHSVFKMGEKMHRNHKHRKMGLDARGVAGLSSVETYNTRIGGADVIDKSGTQKETEYYRHAVFIMDQLANLKPRGHSQENITAMVKDFKRTKLMIKASGVDYYTFLNTASTVDQVKLLIKAMKSGR